MSFCRKTVWKAGLRRASPWNAITPWASQRRYCQVVDEEIHDTHIDIVNGDLIQHVFLPTQSADSNHHRVWQNKIPPELKSCKETLSTNWHVLCPFNVGSNHKTAYPTLVVIVDPSAFDDWRNLAISLNTSVMKAIKDMLPPLKTTMDWV